jgi:hypothetical protein
MLMSFIGHPDLWRYQYGVRDRYESIVQAAKYLAPFIVTA